MEYSNSNRIKGSRADLFPKSSLFVCERVRIRHNSWRERWRERERVRDKIIENLPQPPSPPISPATRTQSASTANRSEQNDIVPVIKARAKRNIPNGTHDSHVNHFVLHIPDQDDSNDNGFHNVQKLSHATTTKRTRILSDFLFSPLCKHFISGANYKMSPLTESLSIATFLQLPFDNDSFFFVWST